MIHVLDKRLRVIGWPLALKWTWRMVEFLLLRCGPFYTMSFAAKFAFTNPKRRLVLSAGTPGKWCIHLCCPIPPWNVNQSLLTRCVPGRRLLAIISAPKWYQVSHKATDTSENRYSEHFLRGMNMNRCSVFVPAASCRILAQFFAGFIDWVLVLIPVLIHMQFLYFW